MKAIKIKSCKECIHVIYSQNDRTIACKQSSFFEIGKTKRLPKNFIHTDCKLDNYPDFSEEEKLDILNSYYKQIGEYLESRKKEIVL